MPPTFTPYLESRSDSTSAEPIAYLPVRVHGAPRPDGSVVVYLLDGTALIVNGGALLQLSAGPDGCIP